jgi:hypothetical protein
MTEPRNGFPEVWKPPSDPASAHICQVLRAFLAEAEKGRYRYIAIAAATSPQEFQIDHGGANGCQLCVHGALTIVQSRMLAQYEEVNLRGR